MIDPYTTNFSKEVGFSWIDNNGKYHCWLVDRMKKHAEQHFTTVIVPVDRDYALWIAEKNGIEHHRLARITPQVIAQIPVIYTELGDGTHKLLDGNHRYLKAAMLGWTEVPAYLFTVEQSNEFKIDVPEHLNERLKAAIPTFSGIF